MTASQIHVDPQTIASILYDELARLKGDEFQESAVQKVLEPWLIPKLFAGQLTVRSQSNKL